MGFKTVNLLVKIDEYKIAKTEIKAFFEDLFFSIRKLKNIGNLVIVSHSKVLETLVPIDAFFFEKFIKDKHEKYFDVSQLDEALKFVNEN